MAIEIGIETEHGPGAVFWDDQDPTNPGWVLRYHLEPEGSLDALGRRHLDEPLDVDGGPDATAARMAALRSLAAMGVGAGRRLTSGEAAEVAGLANAATWRAASWRPDPDGRYDGRTPWWWESTILAALADRPGPGARTDLRGGGGRVVDTNESGAPALRLRRRRISGSHGEAPDLRSYPSPPTSPSRRRCFRPPGGGISADPTSPDLRQRR